ncbi:MAG TPA: 3D domain-containing protein [Gaiellaceae bacterium]|nr:3D domain-containing protein [Gaiellaceae bacterium]
MCRGTRRWGPLLFAVLIGIVALGVAHTSGARAGSSPSVGSYRLKVDAVAYHLPGRTASGLPVGKGIVAVDPRVIPLLTRMHVPGYGPAVAADVGTAIKGRIIDLWMPSTKAARTWGRRTVTITVYR